MNHEQWKGRSKAKLNQRGNIWVMKCPLSLPRANETQGSRMDAQLCRRALSLQSGVYATLRTWRGERPSDPLPPSFLSFPMCPVISYKHTQTDRQQEDPSLLSASVSSSPKESVLQRRNKSKIAPNFALWIISSTKKHNKYQPKQ